MPDYTVFLRSLVVAYFRAYQHVLFAKVVVIHRSRYRSVYAITSVEPASNAIVLQHLLMYEGVVRDISGWG